jgi:hypothetical protein
MISLPLLRELRLLFVFRYMSYLCRCIHKPTLSRGEPDTALQTKHSSFGAHWISGRPVWYTRSFWRMCQHCFWVGWFDEKWSKHGSPKVSSPNNSAFPAIWSEPLTIRELGPLLYWAFVLTLWLSYVMFSVRCHEPWIHSHPFSLLLCASTTDIDGLWALDANCANNLTTYLLLCFLLFFLWSETRYQRKLARNGTLSDE